MKELICKSCDFYNTKTNRCASGRILPTKKNICGIYLEKKSDPVIKKHGGLRPGSGRPKLAGKKVIQSFALTPGTVDFINKYSKTNNLSKSEAVEIIIKSCL